MNIHQDLEASHGSLEAQGDMLGSFLTTSF